VEVDYGKLAQKMYENKKKVQEYLQLKKEQKQQGIYKTKGEGC